MVAQYATSVPRIVQARSSPIRYRASRRLAIVPYATSVPGCAKGSYRTPPGIFRYASTEPMPVPHTAHHPRHRSTAHPMARCSAKSTPHTAVLVQSVRDLWLFAIDFAAQKTENRPAGPSSPSAPPPKQHKAKSTLCQKGPSSH
eukprot:192455-Rhodomonas_salina.1